MGKENYIMNMKNISEIFLNDEINGNIQIFRNFGRGPFLFFDGEYSKGFKIKGKEYNEDGHLLFNGRYVHNLWWEGEIELYDFHKNKIFEGKLVNGKIYGKGKEFYFFYTAEGKLRIKFEGDYLNGKRWNGTGYNLIGKKDFEIKDGNGMIKEYHYIKGNIKFECEYSKGRIYQNKKMM